MNAEATTGRDDRRKLIAFVAPFVVYAAMTTLESQLDPNGFNAPLYAMKIALVSFVLVVTRKQWPPFEAKGVGIGVVGGIVGVVVWIMLAKVDLLSALPESARAWMGGKRSGFNPNHLGTPADQVRLLATTLRLFGLALVVPLMEELFWRGFLLRFLIAEPFHKVPMGAYTPMSFAVVTLAFVAVHPEILAALVWGAAINLLLYRTKNLWACVAMHSTTNALLGAYILATGHWELW